VFSEPIASGTSTAEAAPLRDGFSRESAQRSDAWTEALRRISQSKTSDLSDLAENIFRNKNTRVGTRLASPPQALVADLGGHAACDARSNTFESRGEARTIPSKRDIVVVRNSYPSLASLSSSASSAFTL
jgi:hypothetical protein